MAQETKVEETGCSFQTFERNRYFYGKPMTVTDFEAEQRYLIGKHRYTNRLIHGAGVLCGLQVTVAPNFSAERPAVVISEGAALDCCGNLIVVTSSNSTAEIKGSTLEPKGRYYLYIKYSECEKHPVLAAASVASCGEVCSYNRIQETFEILASTRPPSGKPVETSGGAGTQPKGTGQASLSSTQSNAATVKQVKAPDAPDAASLCRALTEKYYQEHLRTCPACDEPSVFLAVLDMNTTPPSINAAETAKYREVVHSNPMLHDVLCDHLADFANPHRTTAEQVRALQSVNGVGNIGSRAHVRDIALDSQEKTIVVTPQVSASKVNLNLAPNAVKPSHLSDDLITNLLQSSDTVAVEPNTSGKRITLRTKPAAAVTSVGGAKVVGTSGNYSPEDHAHDLADRVVTAAKIADAAVTGTKLAPAAVDRTHLGEDIYDLVVGDGIISVTPDAAQRSIKITAATSPAEDLTKVSSVGAAKKVGESKKFAREDHAHDMRINGRGPDAAGQFLLTPGANVKIENGRGTNELVISSSGGGTGAVSTGIFVFNNVLPGQTRESSLISHGLDEEFVAIILSAESFQQLPTRIVAETRPAGTPLRFGDVSAFDASAPQLMATLYQFQRAIQIHLRDRRMYDNVDAGTETLGSGPPPPPTFEDVASGPPPPTFKEATLVAQPEREGIVVAQPEKGEILTAQPEKDETVVAQPIAVGILPSPMGYRVRWWAIAAPPDGPGIPGGGGPIA